MTGQTKYEPCTEDEGVRMTFQDLKHDDILPMTITSKKLKYVVFCQQPSINEEAEAEIHAFRTMNE